MLNVSSYNNITFSTGYRYQFNNNNNTTPVEDKPEEETVSKEPIKDNLKSQLTFEQRSQIQQEMQMKSLFQQMTINSNSEEEKDGVEVMEDVLSGTQVVDQLEVIDSNVSASTSEKNDFISDKIDEKENTEVTDDTTEESNDKNDSGYVEITTL